jgi:hypothetical protein
MDRIECPRLPTCEMFRVFASAGFTEVWKKAYCLGKFPQCRRYQLFLEGSRVPPNLLPSGGNFPLPARRRPPTR